MKNKYLNGLLPMILINFSIGSVYCWTLFKEDIILFAGFSKSVTEWCFSLAIFILGMSAAFGGKIVERDVKRSCLITFVMFTAGMALTGVGIQIKSPWLTVLSYGVIQGIGLGFGYITPVKTMMLWFADNRGLAAGLSIAGFGMARVIANPLIAYLLETLPVYSSFYVLAALYGSAIFIACWLICRPPLVETDISEAKMLSYREIIFAPKFIFLWLVFFLNITSGLALISQEKQIYHMLGETVISTVVLYVSISSILNLIGRFTMASWQDALKQKHIPYFLMAVASLAVCFVAALSFNQMPQTLLMMWVVNFFFGCGFSCMPNILLQHYGMQQLATVQGLTLSAWAIAGLVGNQLALYIINAYSLGTLYTSFALLYTVELALLLIWSKVAFMPKKDPA